MTHTRLHDILTNNFADKATSLISNLWEEAEIYGEFDDNATYNLTRYEGMTFMEDRPGCKGTRTLSIMTTDAHVICAITGKKYTDIELITFNVC